MANRGFKLLQALFDYFSVHALGWYLCFCSLILKVVALYDLGNHHLGCHNREPQTGLVKQQKLSSYNSGDLGARMVSF